MSNGRILSLDEMSNLLKDRKLYVMAKECGVSYPTLRKILMREREDFTLATLQKVHDYLTKPVM